MVGLVGSVPVPALADRSDLQPPAKLAWCRVLNDLHDRATDCPSQIDCLIFFVND